ncbi:hypothetical protein RRG08_018399 [Elysia crispata]|uniref:Uncharacterized protein n=1 Tax=Elysia crispata TaxID=231223 RepID=A0AAE0ZEA5_9GAST|nr:hypothetical protein RRG08_018399 [Elysia crispata]
MRKFKRGFLNLYGFLSDRCRSGLNRRKVIRHFSLARIEEKVICHFSLARIEEKVICPFSRA